VPQNFGSATLVSVSLTKLILFGGEDVCLIFCEPRQQDVMDLLCCLSAYLCKDAPADLAALALSRLQPSLLADPLSPPTWQLESKPTSNIVPVLGEEDAKPVPDIPTSVIITRLEDIKSSLDGDDEPNLNGDTNACSDGVKVSELTNVIKKPRCKKRTIKVDVDWDGDEKTKKSRKSGTKKIQEGSRKKAGASSGTKNAGAAGGKVNRTLKKKGFESGVMTSADSSVKAEAVDEDEADFDLDIQEANARRFSNIKVSVAEPEPHHFGGAEP
jgi:hypothetical protein